MNKEWTTTKADMDRAVSAYLDYRKQLMEFNIEITTRKSVVTPFAA